MDLKVIYMGRRSEILLHSKYEGRVLEVIGPAFLPLMRAAFHGLIVGLLDWEACMVCHILTGSTEGVESDWCGVDFQHADCFLWGLGKVAGLGDC
jgi:hypothetical protein